MKLFTFFLICSISLATASETYAQKQTVQINTSSRTVKEVLKDIEQQSDFSFFFDNKYVDMNRIVSVKQQKNSISSVLDELFKDTDVKYTVLENKIVLTTIAHSELTQQQKTYLVTGKVVDEAGVEVIGATVKEQNTSNGTITDGSGSFKLKVFASKPTLEVSYIGYKKKIVTVSVDAPLKIVIQEDVESLDEVVVVGYGTMKKSDLTGAITQVKAKDLPQTANMSIGQMLTGKAAGMQVSMTSAQPGGGVWMQIRGNAAGGAGNGGPLYVVDGFPISSGNIEPGSGNRYSSGEKSGLNNLNPADIESIEILKDASATAIYGARAANGVVLITTKRGKEGEKPVIEYSGSVSLQKKARQIEMLSGQEFMAETNKVLYEDWLSDNQIYPYGSGQLSSAGTPFSPRYSDSDIANAKTTDWLGAIERDGWINQHNLSLRGGTKTTAYYISGNFFDQKGVVKKNNIQRYTGRINFDQQIGKYIKAGVNLNVSQVNSDNVPLGTQGNENAGVIRASMNANPTLPIYDEDGSYSLDPQQPFLANPVSLLEITDESSVNEILGNFYLTVTPFKGLVLKMNTGFQQKKGERNTYVPKTTLYGQKSGGEASKALTNQSNKLIDLTASYNTTIHEKHSFGALLGYSYQHFYSNGFNANNTKFITDAFLWNSLSAGESTKPGVGSYGGEEILGSVFGRLNYNFDNRYLLSATMRADASSKFAKNHKWGYFPSVAVAWRVINEKFMKKQSLFSDLKLRVSFGQTGNSNIGNNALALYATGYNYNFGDQSYVGVAQSQLENPNLKWETTTELNIGLDFGLFNNRITGSMEYFTRRIDDLLSNKQLMQYNPISTVMANIGAKGSKGFELGLTTHNFVGEFNWSTDFVFSLYRDRWLERDPQWKKAVYENEKDMLNPYYLYLSDGLVQPEDMNPDGTCNIAHMPNAKPGMIKYKDVNGRGENGELTNKPDGKLDDADIVYLGTKTSKYYAGIGNTFNYKNFDLNIFFYGYFGRKLENPAYDWYLKSSWFLKNGVNMAKEVKNRWSSSNVNGKYPNSMMNPYERASDFWLENADFIRCKNITLGYTLPLSNQAKKAIEKARIYCDVQNPFVITKYSGVDPEMDGMAAYPTQLTVSFGVNLTF